MEVPVVAVPFPVAISQTAAVSVPVPGVLVVQAQTPVVVSGPIISLIT
jgi:hypothetical protein